MTWMHNIVCKIHFSNNIFIIGYVVAFAKHIHYIGAIFVLTDSWVEWTPSSRLNTLWDTFFVRAVQTIGCNKY